MKNPFGATDGHNPDSQATRARPFVRLRILQLHVVLATLIASPGAAITPRWFDWAPVEDGRVAVIDAAHLLNAPAGEHGFLQIREDRLVFEDGTPAKLWGVNINAGNVAPTPAEGARWARLLAKYGMNAVRFHKFLKFESGKDGIASQDTVTEINPKAADRFDRFHHELKSRGIYVGWSPVYGLQPSPGDASRLLAYDEVSAAGEGHLKGSMLGLVNFAPDLQALQIDAVVSLLERVNPHTGLRYADDPGLAYVELQNEDNIYFPTALNFVESCPTYKKLLCKQFSDWLSARYGDHSGLVAAWGAEAIDAFPRYMSGELLDRGNLYPPAHRDFLSPEALANEATRQRLLDTAQFLHETQNAFYERFARAIRATGFRGFIVGSCWQAGSGITHYYNLHNDYLAGAIDRHNYYGGGRAHRLQAGPINNTSMLSRPGKGLLGVGMQQVADRPFLFSEWIARPPNEWSAEGPAIVAVYGMGLQGRDGSFHFCQDDPGPSRQQHVYNALDPSQIGQYAALSRLVHRGDVQPAPTHHERVVHIPSLREGRVGFRERLIQNRDEKRVDGVTPIETLAVGRTVIRFAEEFAPTSPPELRPYHDSHKETVSSTTGQLHWDYSEDGWISIDTPSTQGVVGFTDGAEIRLADVSIRLDNRFAVLYVTSLDDGRGIADSSSLLVTAIARTRNTGMLYDDARDALLAVGGGPIQVEGVAATLTFKEPREALVHVLDQSGVRTGRTLQPRQQRETTQVRLNGAEHETIYFEIEFDP